MLNDVVLAIFQKREDADKAIDELHNKNYEADEISVIVKDDVVAYKSDQAGKKDRTGLKAGAVIGGIIGLVAGLTVITIPGFGGLLIAGPLAEALGITVGSTALGALAGGLVGGLVDLGIPEDVAKAYEAHMKAGAILIAVPIREGNEGLVEDILRNNGGEQIHVIK